MPPAPPTPLKTMPRAAGRAIFGAEPQAYHDARVGYPAALFNRLRQRIGPAPRILEIGPGSGLATEGLLTLEPCGYLGVESDADFVGYLRARFPRPEMAFVNASFPAPALLAQTAGQFDLAACAAAFHWLEPTEALAALRALLRPGGLWAMWWNSYLNPGSGSGFGTRAMAVLEEEGVALPPSFGVQGHLSLDVAGQMQLLSDAGLIDIEHSRWEVVQPLDAAAAEALFRSFSFVRLLPDGHRAHVLSRLTRLVDEEFGGTAPNVVLTNCYTARNPAAGGAALP